jgi:hypothetical protein
VPVNPGKNETSHNNTQNITNPDEDKNVTKKNITEGNKTHEDPNKNNS